VTRIFAAVLTTALFISPIACRRTQAQDAPPAAAQTPAEPEPAKPVPAQLPEVLARVNGEDVTRAEFEQLIKNMEMSQGREVPAERRNEIFRGALDQLVTYTVLAQEIKARRIAVADAEVDTFVQSVRQRFPNEDAFKKALGERGMTEQKLRDDARMNMSINQLMEAEAAAIQPATEAESRDFYQKNPKEFEQPEAVRASHILIAADQNDETAKTKARAEAEAVLKKARSGADFAQLAKQHSSDGSAQQGGDLDFFERGRMVPAFDEAAFALQTGQISGVVETQFGYHIIKVTDRRAGSVVPFEQVDQQIRQFLTEKNKKTHVDSFVEGLKKKARIEVLI
jgi:peptidyl-prolyl cis-trans isomerase C